MRPLSRNPQRQRFAPRYPRWTEEFPHPALAATASSTPSVALLEKGGSAPQGVSVIDRRAAPDSRWSMDAQAPYAEARAPVLQRRRELPLASRSVPREAQ